MSYVKPPTRMYKCIRPPGASAYISIGEIVIMIGVESYADPIYQSCECKTLTGQRWWCNFNSFVPFMENPTKLEKVLYEIKEE